MKEKIKKIFTDLDEYNVIKSIVINDNMIVELNYLYVVDLSNIDEVLILSLENSVYSNFGNKIQENIDVLQYLTNIEKIKEKVRKLINE